jgi:hypothetical protein
MSQARRLRVEDTSTTSQTRHLNPRQASHRSLNQARRPRKEEASTSQANRRSMIEAGRLRVEDTTRTIQARHLSLRQSNR